MSESSDEVGVDPSIAGANADAQRFRCPSCAANMRFDATAGKLSCDFCGTQIEVAGESDRSIVEYDLESGIAMASARGYGTETRRTTCGECGATVSLGANITADHCDFCGSPQVMVQEENRNILRPESLVPFAVADTVAKDKFRGWLQGLWFRPNALKRDAHVKDLVGVYVPYWTYDSLVDSDWTADAGYYYYTTESYSTRDSNGNMVTKTRQVRRTRWERAWGNRRDHYDDILICASKGLPPKLVNRLKTFDTKGLVVYQPQFLAGWRAEEYAVELNDGWRDAVSIMETSQRRRCSRDVPGDTQRFLNVFNRYSQQTFKHVLLPIWISSYRYRDKVHRFLVNGQTGEVTGTAPYSVIKICLAIAVVAALIAGAIILSQSR